jgi:peptidoglycan DL-endopeptidase CwlO
MVRVALAAAAASLLTLSFSSTASPVRIVYGYPYADRCPAAGIGDVVDRWGMYACNCTSYVAWALVANHQSIDWFIPGAMDARNWPHVARLSHLRVDRHPAPGAVAVWPSLARPFGHVAYVTAVHRDGTFDVAEYNYPDVDGLDTFLFNTRTGVRRAGATFIHVPAGRDEADARAAASSAPRASAAGPSRPAY